MEFPVAVATARPSPRLPTAPGYWFEPKADGHRVVAWREDARVRLQSRSGRDVTSSWPDLAEALMALPVGAVVDGEAVVEVAGRLDFSAAQSRKASSAERAAVLAVLQPALYFCWDVLRFPDPEASCALVDVRHRFYTERRGLLLNLVGGIGRPVVVLPATDDVVTAQAWFDDRELRERGFEGVVAKPGSSPYRSTGDVWVKVRHAETVDAKVIGFAGPSGRPRRLAVRLPDGRTVLTRPLGPILARQVAEAAAGTDGAPARTSSGESYRTLPAGLVVEVLAGTTRHATVDATRLRSAGGGSASGSRG
ncbi:DNA ligase [Streptomyces misionensis]|uniref:ATP-dependent DNA ligase n=1 Tax=Streptomyces misionensis TaxID=67331 RepID=UPI00343A7E5C